MIVFVRTDVRIMIVCPPCRCNTTCGGGDRSIGCVSGHHCGTSPRDRSRGDSCKERQQSNKMHSYQSFRENEKIKRKKRKRKRKPKKKGGNEEQSAWTLRVLYCIVHAEHSSITFYRHSNVAYVKIRKSVPGPMLNKYAELARGRRKKRARILNVVS